MGRGGEGRGAKEPIKGMDHRKISTISQMASKISASNPLNIQHHLAKGKEEKGEKEEREKKEKKEK